MTFGTDLTRGWSSGGVGITPFPDPFLDYASLAMPQSMHDALHWCESLMLANGIYRSAMDRVVSYFVTDIDIRGEDRKIKDKYLEYLHDYLGIKSLLREFGLNYVTYGNIFFSVLQKNDRYVYCPNCSFETTAERLVNSPSMQFKWKFAFFGRCPVCHYSGRFKHIDRKSDDAEDIYVKTWNPKEIEIIWDPFTEDTDYVWKIPANYRRLLTQGSKFHVVRADWDIIAAVKANQYFRINRDLIYHGKEDTLAGVVNRGWGISRLLTNFRQAWYVQLLHRINEAVGADYVIPLRVITPEARNGAGGAVSDPLMNLDLGGFTGAVNSMLHRRQIDPASWFTLPFPIKYQVLGGEANQLAPYQLIEQGMDTLLSSAGIPLDFYKGSMTIQSAPISLRLMESNWSHLLHMLNRALQWLVDRVSELTRWDSVKVTLARPSHVDDLNRQLAKMQLMMSREISKRTGLQTLGLDFDEEQERIMEEEEIIAEKAQETQEKLEAKGLGQMMAIEQQGPMGQMLPGNAQPAGEQGGAAAGGAPAPAGAPGGDPVQAVLAMLPQSQFESLTPQDIEQRAQTIASMLFAMPETLKDSTLRQIKQLAPSIHALVKEQLAALRRQAAVQGVASAQQQAQAGQVTP